MDGRRDARRDGFKRVGFININDMYNNDVGKGVVYAYEAYEAKQRVVAFRAPFYFINLLPTSLLYISILLRYVSKDFFFGSHLPICQRCQKKLTKYVCQKRPDHQRPDKQVKVFR